MKRFTSDIICLSLFLFIMTLEGADECLLSVCAFLNEINQIGDVFLETYKPINRLTCGSAREPHSLAFPLFAPHCTLRPKRLSSGQLRGRAQGVDLPSDEIMQTVIPFRGTPPRGIVLVDDRMLALIARLRTLWRHSQLSGREDFDHACVLISGDDNTTIERYAAAFFQGTQLFALRRLKFFNAKAQAVSEDEMWVARLLMALYSEDYTSARYLMALRISPEGRRRLMFLAQGLAARLCAESVAPAGGEKSSNPQQT